MNMIAYEEARELLMAAVKQVGTERVSLSESGGRILAQTVTASENVPPFDRSPFDGYTFRSEDVKLASRENPVTLQILEEVAAGATPTKVVTPGTAVKILTGAPISEGADAVIKFEDTEFDKDTVTIFQPFASGKNIIRTGEDVARGMILAEPGKLIDPGIAGILSGQGISQPLVYKIPRVGIIATGDEVVEVDEGILPPGKIRNTNRYILETAIRSAGCEPVFLGIAGDDAEVIREAMERGMKDCSAIVLTGGVSVGDYDLTPAAMKLIGVDIMVTKVALKPGGSCAYGMKDDVLFCGLSGNPASCMTNFYAIALPLLRKMCGHRNPHLEPVTVTLKEEFRKNSPYTRIMRGKMEFEDGKVMFSQAVNQGNVVIRSLVDCNLIAEVPANSGVLPAGTRLQGYLL